MSQPGKYLYSYGQQPWWRIQDSATGGMGRGAQVSKFYGKPKKKGIRFLFRVWQANNNINNNSSHL